MAEVPVRVIPRPSERMGVAHRESKTLDLRDRGTASARQISKTPLASARSMETSARDKSMRAVFNSIGVVSAIVAGLGFGFLGLSGRADTTVGLVMAPTLAAITFFAIDRWIRPRIGDALAAVVFAGFGVRMAASIPRLLGGADSPVYQQEGARIAVELRALNFGVDAGRAIPGTGTVRYLSGIVNVFTGSTYIATFLIFAAVAFVGQCFFLLAMQSVLSSRQFRFLSVALMMSPTLAYWPSSIGKESLSLLGIGLGAYGASQVYDRHWRGLSWVVLGTVTVGMIRPHVAMILFAGLFVGLMARKAHTRRRLATHLALLVVIVTGAMWMADASADLFGLEGLDRASDVSAALDFAQERTSQDQSQFEAARVNSPLDYPKATVTVFFRPFPWEANSPAAMVSAAESMAVFGLLMLALPGLVGSAPLLVQRGQLLYSVAFTAVFVYLFSAIGNFGILSRQRAQVVPFLLLFVAFGIGVEKARGSGDRVVRSRSAVRL